MKPRAWFRFNNAADDPAIADLYIFDDIGKSWWDDDAVSAKKFVDELNALPAKITTARVHVNSLGGDVFDGVAIANSLRAWAKNGRTVVTIVDGVAASTASIVIMAGTTIQISDNGMVFVHDPWTIGIGNSKDMRKLADDLDAIRGSILATYKWHSTLDDDALLALMDAETWMDADEAITNGFATEKVEGLKAAATLDARALAKLKVPDKFKDRVSAWLKPEPPAPPVPAAASASDVLAMCTEAGLDLPFASALIAAKATTEDVQARVSTEKTARATATTRATEITALCATAKMPTLAAGYIKGGISVDDVRAHLTTVTALRDSTIDIDGSLPADQGARAKATLSTADIYAARNRSPKKE